MFEIYDPRRGKDFGFKDIWGDALFSTLEKNILFFYSEDESQSCNEKLIKHLAREHFLGTGLLLNVSTTNKKIISEIKKRFKNASFLPNRKDLILTADANLENIEILAACYKDLQDWEEWTIGFVIPQKEKDLIQRLPNDVFALEDLILKFPGYFKALFCANFEVPELYLFFFEESKFDEIIQSVPLV